MSDDLIVPQVSTLAKPLGRTLLDVRFEIQRNNEVRATFEKYKGRKDPEAPALLTDEIVDMLAYSLNTGPEQLREACRYLADEYLQVGDSVLVISRQTGKAIARLTEKDMWQPEAVPRFGGDMVVPAARIRPELQGFLVRWEFERDREQRIVNELAERFPSIPGISPEEDRRLLPTTRVGREVIVRDLRDSLPTLLQTALGGKLGRLIRLLDGQHEGKLTRFPGFKAYARVTVQMMDHKARNLLFDVLNSHRAVIAAQWGREIARTLSRLAHDHGVVHIEDFQTYNPDSELGLWIAPPDEALAFRGRPVQFTGVIPIENALTTLVWNGSLGRLHCGETHIASREIHDRWEIAATLDYDLDLDLSCFSPRQFTNLPQVAYTGEVVD